MTSLSVVDDFASLKAAKTRVERQKELNRKKKLKKKSAKQRRIDPHVHSNGYSKNDEDNDSTSRSTFEAIEFDFKGPFERFKLKATADDLDEDESKGKILSHTEVNLKARTAALLEEEQRLEELRKKYPGYKDDDDDEDRNNSGTGLEDGSKASDKSLSKKKIKLLSRPTVSALKRTVSRPDVVEMWDVCAKDPLLLVYLKSYRNTVPVPRHWCAKRKYLQGKRGYEKPPFRLPDYIARTGIMEMRQTVQDKETDKSLKQKMREKIRPKVGRVDIDYHKLHDAFFKYQTKPLLTSHGDLYYEGREFEIKLKEKKPGNLSDDLKMALGLPTGTNSDKYPPPWLIAMQRYGPPPSYPNLKIPGLNAPIPTGCAFGYHPGGWGKPPVDELGRPIYGDVFGNGGNIAGAPPPPPSGLISMLPGSELTRMQDAEIASGKITHWGEWESEVEEEEVEEESDAEGSDHDSGGEAAVEGAKRKPEGADSDMDEDEDTPVPNRRPPVEVYTPGIVTPSGAASYVTQSEGMLSTDATIELRKRTIEEQMESYSGFATPAVAGLNQGELFRVLPERGNHVGASQLMGSSKLYDVSGIGDTNVRGIEAENPRDKMIRKRSSHQLQDDSETASAQQSKSSGPQTKKYKEFKF